MCQATGPGCALSFNERAFGKNEHGLPRIVFGHWSDTGLTLSSFFHHAQQLKFQDDNGPSNFSLAWKLPPGHTDYYVHVFQPQFPRTKYSLRIQINAPVVSLPVCLLMIMGCIA
jgi:hypothetical protein